MPTKLNVGLTRKAGLPNYGSIGASCHLEIELDPTILVGDLDRFHYEVNRAYSACWESVENELTRKRQENAPNALSSSSESIGNSEHQNGKQQNVNGSNSNIRATVTHHRNITSSQMRAINAIAARYEIDLQPFFAQFDINDLEELSIGRASRFIDELKAVAECPKGVLGVGG